MIKKFGKRFFKFFMSISQINSIIDQSEEWKAEAHAQFIKPDDTSHTLLDVLLPRHSKQPTPKPHSRKKKQKSTATGEPSTQQITGNSEKLIDKVRFFSLQCCMVNTKPLISHMEIRCQCKNLIFFHLNPVLATTHKCRIFHSFKVVPS